MLYFGRRGRENLHEQKVSHFAASTDDKGCVYVYSMYDELTKNYQNNSIQPMDACIVYQVCLYLLKHTNILPQRRVIKMFHVIFIWLFSYFCTIIHCICT